MKKGERVRETESEKEREMVNVSLGFTFFTIQEVTIPFKKQNDLT